MNDQGINWNEIERNQRGRRSNRYVSRLCPLCGRTIQESAYSGRDGNWKKHSKACEKKHQSKDL